MVYRRCAPAGVLLKTTRRENSCHKTCTALRFPARQAPSPNLKATLPSAWTCTGNQRTEPSRATPAACSVSHPDISACRVCEWSVCAWSVCSGEERQRRSVCKGTLSPLPQFAPQLTLRTPATTKKNINFFFRLLFVHGPNCVQYRYHYCLNGNAVSVNF